MLKQKQCELPFVLILAFWLLSEWVEFYVPLSTWQVISEMSLSMQSLALVLTTQNRQEKIHLKKHKINKLALT